MNDDNDFLASSKLVYENYNIVFYKINIWELTYQFVIVIVIISEKTLSWSSEIIYTSPSTFKPLTLGT